MGIKKHETWRSNHWNCILQTRFYDHRAHRRHWPCLQRNGQLTELYWTLVQFVDYIENVVKWTQKWTSKQDSYFAFEASKDFSRPFLFILIKNCFKIRKTTRICVSKSDWKEIKNSVLISLKFSLCSKQGRKH